MGEAKRRAPRSEVAANKASTEQATKVLGTLFDTGVIHLPLAGDVAIKKVTLRTMKPILQLLTGIMEGMGLSAEEIAETLAAESDVAGAKGGVEKLPDRVRSPVLILKLISNHYDAVMEIAVSLSDLSLDKLLDMEGDESLIVLQAILARNRSFFTTRVLPALQLIGLIG